MDRKRIAWGNHAVELIVVFIGITAAFMLNNWREDQRDHAQEQQYVSSFHDALIRDGNRLDTLNSFNREKLDFILRIINSMQRGDVPDDSLMLAISRMAEINLFMPKTNIYESIKYSGNFNLIRDYDLRTQLIGYYESFEGQKLIEDYYRMYIDTYIIPFLFEHLDMTQGEVVDAFPLNTVRMKNLIVAYYQMLEQVAENYRETLEANKELRSAIEEQYPSLKE